MQIRELTELDAQASMLTSRDPFGPVDDNAATFVTPDIHRWGIFDGELLAAKASDREYVSLIGGRPVTTAGAAGVVVAPEYRGTGLAQRVMSHLLAQARQRGAAISTLFRTAPALYRSLGYEQVTDLVIGEVPAAALRGLRVHPSIAVRRAQVGDASAIRTVYAKITESGSCLLNRIGPGFAASDQELVDAFDGITVATDEDGSMVGYFSWHRGREVGSDGVLAITELHTLTAPATQSLLAVAGSFDMVTPTIRIRTSGTDPIHWTIPAAGWSVTNVRPYMLRVVDLATAVRQRGWPVGLTAAIDIEVDDPVCPWNSGRHQLKWSGGEAELRPGRPSGVTIDPRGLALLMAGDITAATMRRAGLLAGGGHDVDAILDAAMAGPRPAILDEF
ncbi:MAG: GNAT family N-acetyltransferase [Nakamurella sp.]